MNSSDFRNLTGWIDYDRDQLPNLTDKQKVAYFVKRLNMALVKPLRHLYQGISKGSKENSILLYGTCTCCAIEALGKFYSGGTILPQPHGIPRGNENWLRFQSFLHAYMHANYRTKKINKTGYDMVLWQSFRNGLAHGLAISNGGFEHGTRYFRERKVGARKILILDPKYFHDDFLSAISRYIKDLKNADPSDPLSVNFIKTFDDVFIRGN